MKKESKKRIDLYDIGDSPSVSLDTEKLMIRF